MTGHGCLPRPVPGPRRSVVTAPVATPFSTQIREASHQQHTEAENSSFMSDLLGGGLGVEAFRLYTEQLWFVYRALEAPTAQLAADPVAGPFVRPELARVAELERDLDHMHGSAAWRDEVRPLPATAAYAERITETATGWTGGYVAHHYTRYLGDLSGGQVIRSIAEKTWGFEPKGDGVRFYVFEGIGNPAAFKREYRTLLDAVPGDDAERLRIVEECKRAFSLNSAVFQDLGAATSR
ncbi:heme oxygenase (biliverdin-producing) [Streptomyces spiramenti]|uniref:Biliverdin-producing heme oxygenase n=1 Tax=Streptomyces spiramenti TaxID=2720606 RepID=A0ABX1ARW2_9ACTN|nr:biliverdin-producing heme oxygenase [Streptomyces spiramenti]NJP67443.1 biliverdin-producing heme oxygenase [Streptomyces spiramenti]